jgi:hypothetical protein
MKKIDEIIENLKYERRTNGEIIDDRSMNRIPFQPYVKQYEELDRIIEILESERDGRCVVLPIWGTVYIVSNGTVQEMNMVHYRGNTMGVYDMRCECTEQYEDCEAICNNENEKACAYNFRIAEIGKTVFFTYAEAKVALSK